MFFRPMKRSQQVPASLVVAIAASVTAAGCGCGPDYVDQCVDSMGRLLPAGACQPGGVYYGRGYTGAHWIHVQTGGFGSSGGGWGGGGFGGG